MKTFILPPPQKKVVAALMSSNTQGTNHYIFVGDVSFFNIWFAIRRLNKYILYSNSLSKGMHATQYVTWNEMYKSKVDMKYPGYEPEPICAQG